MNKKINVNLESTLGIIGSIIGIIFSLGITVIGGFLVGAFFNSSAGVIRGLLVLGFSILGLVGSIIIKEQNKEKIKQGSYFMLIGGIGGFLITFTFSILFYIVPGILLISAGILGINKLKWISIKIYFNEQYWNFP